MAWVLVKSMIPAGCGLQDSGIHGSSLCVHDYKINFVMLLRIANESMLDLLGCHAQ